MLRLNVTVTRPTFNQLDEGVTKHRLHDYMAGTLVPPFRVSSTQTRNESGEESQKQSRSCAGQRHQPLLIFYDPFPHIAAQVGSFC